MKHIWMLLIAAICLATPVQAENEADVARPDSHNVDVNPVRISNNHFLASEFGAKGDGTADDTAAFQKALDAAAKAGGGSVVAGRGNFLFAGHLNVPAGVALEGTWKVVPAHQGLRDKDASRPTDNTNRHAIQANGGKLLVRGCEFLKAKPQIALGENLQKAVITGNILTGPAKIANHSKGRVQIIGNAED